MAFADKIRQYIFGVLKVKEAPGGGKATAITPANAKAFFVKPVGLFPSANDFLPPEYDLEEIKAAINTDSYIKQAVLKYKQLVLKAGGRIISENENAAEYIRTRLRIMNFATGKPFEILLQETADDLFAYSNAFWVKTRVDKMPFNINAKGVLDTKLVGGYFRVDPTTMEIKRDKSGNVTQYQQNVNGQQKKFKTTDVVHFYIDREGGNAFGTPRIVAAIEDVKLLRKFESIVVNMIYRYAIPLLHAIVGLPEAGFQATDKEITDVKSEIEKMSSDGVLVTNERVKLQFVGSEGEAIDAAGYLDYFEKRVFTALGMSEAMMGRGGAKKEAESMEAMIHDTVKYVQRTISVFVENFVLNELLLEGGFNPILNEQDIVKYEFEEIDLETRVKMENHAVNKFQSNVIQFEEVRRAIGLRSDNVDESRLYKNMIENKAILEQIEAKTQSTIAIAQATGKTSGIGGNGQEKSTGSPNGAVKNIDTPTNQHGTTSVKLKESANYNLSNAAKTQQDVYEKICKKYYEACNDIIGNGSTPEIVLPLTKDAIVVELEKEISSALSKGIEAAKKDANADNGAHIVPNTHDIVMIANKTVVNLFKDILAEIKKCNNAQDIRQVFEKKEFRLKFVASCVIPKAYWYGYVKTCAAIGISEVEIDFDSSEDEKYHNKTIKTDAFSLDDIPAFHANCDCKVIFRTEVE